MLRVARGHASFRLAIDLGGEIASLLQPRGQLDDFGREAELGPCVRDACEQGPVEPSIAEVKREPGGDRCLVGGAHVGACQHGSQRFDIVALAQRARRPQSALRPPPQIARPEVEIA